MGAIGAILWKDGRPADTAALDRLAQGLRPYGKGARSVVVAGPCGLIRAGDGPVREPPAGDGRLFVFEGRLDNRDEIAARLSARAASLDRRSDTAVARASWLAEGEAGVRTWVGPFAFLAFDPAAGVLAAARDHVGLRGLAWHETPERIAVASAPRALTALADVERAVDEQKIADQLVQLFDDGERSFYKGIARLLPAHLMTVTSQGNVRRRYWSLADAPDIRLGRDEDYVEAGRAVLERAVAAAVGDGRRIGAFLSGGLDSTTVAVTALGVLPAEVPLAAFTWVPSQDWDGRCRPGRYGDERPLVEAVAAMHPRIVPHYVAAEGHGLFHRLDEFLDLAGAAPRNAMNLCWMHDIHAAAAGEGLAVLLDGAMGNMGLSWSGEGVYGEHWRAGAWGRLMGEIVGGGPGLGGAARRLANGLVFPLAPDWVHGAWRTLRDGAGALPPWRKFSAIDPGFARDMKVEERMAAVGWDFFTGPMRDPKALRASLATASLAHERADLEQGFRALHGVEMRDPLSDWRLLEWCLGVPESQYRRNGVGRWLIRRIMAGRLPPAVLGNRLVGEQVIDWPARLAWDLPRLRDELEAIEADPDTARYLDTGLIRRCLDTWTEDGPPKLAGRGHAFIPVGIGSAIAAARLVRRTKGANR